MDASSQMATKKKKKRKQHAEVEAEAAVSNGEGCEEGVKHEKKMKKKKEKKRRDPEVEGEASNDGGRDEEAPASCGSYSISMAVAGSIVDNAQSFSLANRVRCLTETREFVSWEAGF